MLLLFGVNPYKQLSLFPEADTVRRKLFQEFDLVARQLDQGPPQNPFVTLRDGELHLKRPDALEVPERIHGLRQTIETRLPRIRIEDLPRDVDKRCGFTQAFRPLPGYESRLENLYPTLLAAITAHATNLGTAAVAQSAEGITLEGLQEVSRCLLENDSVLRLREHSTDTHGYIEDPFGLCYLLGYSFTPRIRDVADQQLYRIDRDAVYP